MTDGNGVGGAGGANGPVDHVVGRIGVGIVGRGVDPGHDELAGNLVVDKVRVILVYVVDGVGGYHEVGADERTGHADELAVDLAVAGTGVGPDNQVPAFGGIGRVRRVLVEGDLGLRLVAGCGGDRKIHRVGGDGGYVAGNPLPERIGPDADGAVDLLSVPAVDENGQVTVVVRRVIGDGRLRLVGGVGRHLEIVGKYLSRLFAGCSRCGASSAVAGTTEHDGTKEHQKRPAEFLREIHFTPLLP